MRVAMLFVLPYLVLFVLFRIAPAIAGLALSFADYGITGKVEFVGSANFERLLAAPLFRNALLVTIAYAVIVVPAVVCVSLATAQLAVRGMRGLAVYRTLYFLPVITSLVTSAVVWKWLYSEKGPLNWLVSLFGMAPVPWISDDTLVVPALSVIGVWSRFGFDMLILLAGMLAIPRELEEASAVDGATAWQRFLHITLPQLRRPLLFVVVLESIHALQVFDIIFVMTGGGPVRSSYSLVYFIYDQGFGFFQFGYASAAGVVLLAVTLMLALIQRRALERSAT